jgi:hypothetical protein
MQTRHDNWTCDEIIPKLNVEHWISNEVYIPRLSQADPNRRKTVVFSNAHLELRQITFTRYVSTLRYIERLNKLFVQTWSKQKARPNLKQQ